MSDASLSEKALGATIRELYRSKDEEEPLPTFFRLVSNEGEEFKVHSSLMVTRSEFFKKLLESNFREKNEESATVAMSTLATEQMVRFIYGFDLATTLPLDTVKELLVSGGVYGLENLQEAAGEALSKLLTKENVFELLDFVKKHRAEGAINVCAEFASKNFEKKYLLKSGHIAKNTEIAAKILEVEDDPKEDSYSQTVMCCDSMDGVSFSEIEKTFELKINDPGNPAPLQRQGIKFKGLGLYLNPGTEVLVRVTNRVLDFYLKVKSETLFNEKVSVPDTSCTRATKLIFDHPVEFIWNRNSIKISEHYISLSVKVTGKGSARTIKDGEKTERTARVKTAICKTQPIQLETSKDSIVGELYFTSPSNSKRKHIFTEILMLSFQ